MRTQKNFHFRQLHSSLSFTFCSVPCMGLLAICISPTVLYSDFLNHETNAVNTLHEQWLQNFQSLKIAVPVLLEQYLITGTASAPLAMIAAIFYFKGFSKCTKRSQRLTHTVMKNAFRTTILYTEAMNGEIIPLCATTELRFLTPCILSVFHSTISYRKIHAPDKHVYRNHKKRDHSIVTQVWFL